MKYQTAATRAVATYQLIVKVQPNDEQALFSLAQAADTLRQTPVAIRAYKQAPEVQAGPRHRRADPPADQDLAAVRQHPQAVRLRADGKTPVKATAGGTMNFDIKTEQLGDDAYVISLAGEVDLYTAPEFKQQLLEVIGQGGKQVIVDFSNTTFIDSTTLGVLVGGVKRLRTNEGQLSLVCSDRNITKIFEITGLDRVFTIYPTRAEAVSNVKSADKPPA